MGSQTMKITADTNLLVRAVTGDHALQSEAAQMVLKDADVVALAIPALCELVWVLSQGYKIPVSDIAEAIRRLMNSANVVVNRPAAEAGLVLLGAGGDFADGVIAYEGSWLGADAFVSFDKKAVKLMEAQGWSARLLG
jgi:predicted nucleic-acid-binding protein